MILIGIDNRAGAGDALALGKWLSAVRGEQMLLAWVHPFKELPSLLDEGPDVDQVREAVEALAVAVRDTLPAELRPELRLLSGRSPAGALHELAERDRASIIVIGPSERAGLGRILPGRTGVRLLSGSGVPVAISPSGYRPERATTQLIGVGYDGSEEADQALAWAVSLARQADTEVRLIAVHEPVSFSHVGVGAFPVERVSQVLRRELQEDVEKAMRAVDGVSVDAIFGEGDPASFLAEQSADFDLLVLGSRGYGPVRSVLLGSVSEATVSSALAPVLVVPRGHELDDGAAAQLETAASA